MQNPICNLSTKKITLRSWLTSFVCFLLIACNGGDGVNKTPINKETDFSSPNIIFILADDLGYTDVGYFAQHLTRVATSTQYYETPHIDQIANQGVAFTQAYAHPVCSPSRASLLTGKMPARMGFTTAAANRNKTSYAKGGLDNDEVHILDIVQPPESTPDKALNNGSSQTALLAGTPFDNGIDEITIAEVLDNYRTAYLGKWHIGGHGVEGYQPSDQGFTELAYFDAGSSPYYSWRTLWKETSENELDKGGKKMPRGRLGDDTGAAFLTDELTQQALNYLDERANDKDPFLLYFSHFAVHGPFQAEKDTINRFKQKQSKGWKGHGNDIYAAMVSSLDDSVGAIMAKLERSGLDENTYVIFMSDNGGVDYLINEVGDKQKGNPENPAPTSNTPLVGGKATVYEGGVRVPLIIWKKNNGQLGKLVDVVVDTSDLFPTMLAMAGKNSQEYIERVENTENSIDGQSLLPLLDDTNNTQNAYTKDTLYWHYPFNVRVNNPKDLQPLTPHSAMRQGDYKLIIDWYGRLSLYNLKADPYESVNLGGSEPEKLTKMCKQLISWLDSNVEKHYHTSKNRNYNSAIETRTQPYRNVRELEQCAP